VKPPALARRALGALTLLLASCTAVDPLTGSPEWLEVSAGAAIVERREPQDLDDAFGWRVGGGYDFNADRVRVSWEIDAQWSSHDVEASPVADARISAWTIGTGLRLTADLDPLPLSIYGRGGVAWRQESSSDDLLEENDGTGSYFGCGLEWRHSPSGSIGPSVVWYRDDEGEFRSRYAAITARFSL
jgi:hypothetical protein